MRACARARVRVHECVCAACVRVCGMRACVRVRMRACVRVCMRACMRVCMRACMCVCVRVCVRAPRAAHRCRCPEPLPQYPHDRRLCRGRHLLPHARARARAIARGVEEQPHPVLLVAPLLVDRSAARRSGPGRGARDVMCCATMHVCVKWCATAWMA